MENENKGMSKAFASALIKAMSKIEGAVKESSNLHFKAKYADLASVISAVKQPLLENGFGFMQPVGRTEGGVWVETILIHDTGETYSFGKLEVPLDKNNAHGIGSAISYGRRYQLSSALGVPAVDDDGNAAAGQEDRKVEAKRIPAPAQVAPREPIPTIYRISDADMTQPLREYITANAQYDEASDLWYAPDVLPRLKRFEVTTPLKVEMEDDLPESFSDPKAKLEALKAKVRAA